MASERMVRANYASIFKLGDYASIFKLGDYASMELMRTRVMYWR
jgi:hypothetical protein